MTRVEITTAGHSIVVESDDELDVLAVTALDLWRQTRDPKLDRGWGVAALAVADLAGESYYASHDADMAARSSGGRP